MLPPGPPRSLRTLVIYGPGRDPLKFFSGLARDYGDISTAHVAVERLVLLNHPQLVKDVLVTHQRNFRKGRGLEQARKVLGEGLLTSEGQVHLRQRRLIQPAFHKDRIAAYGTVMAEHARHIQAGWRDGDTMDVAAEMSRLTLGIVGKTLFDADVEAEAKNVGKALTAVLDSFWLTMLPLIDVLERLPLPVFRRGREARLELDRIIYQMIAERRQSLHDRGDLLSMLLLAQDDEEDGQAGPVRQSRGHEGHEGHEGQTTSEPPRAAARGMSDRQVRDEAMTIFLAGHETTANALSWMWYLLSSAPDVEAELHGEVDRVLGDSLPTLADLPRLPVTERIVTEAMRLYPPAWIIGRRAIDDYPVGDYVVPARSIVLVSPYLLHRDGRFFPEPDRFMPARWTPEFKASLPPFAYFPFGGGTRRCIGESFALMELILVAATLARRWRFRLVPDHPVVPQPVVTLRMKHGLRMVASRRG